VLDFLFSMSPPPCLLGFGYLLSSSRLVVLLFLSILSLMVFPHMLGGLHDLGGDNFLFRPPSFRRLAHGFPALMALHFLGPPLSSDCTWDRPYVWAVLCSRPPLFARVVSLNLKLTVSCGVRSELFLTCVITTALSPPFFSHLWSNHERPVCAPSAVSCFFPRVGFPLPCDICAGTVVTPTLDLS